MRLVRRKASGLLALFLLLGLTACGVQDARGSRGPRPGIKVFLRGAGATFPSPLYARWIQAFEEAEPGTMIDYDAGGSGEGERLFREGAVDFGATDAGFQKVADDALSGVHPRGLQLVPTCAGSVVVVYNLGPDFEGELRLSRENLVDIFLGRIDAWNDPRIRETNPTLALPDLPVARAVRVDGSGTTFAFTNHLSAVSPQWAEGPGRGKAIDWPGTAMQVHGNEGVAGIVKRYPGAIGYVAFEFSNLLDLPRATLQNRAGNFVRPTPQSGSRTIANLEVSDTLRAYAPDPAGQDSYPIVTLTWVALYRDYEDPAKLAALQRFLAYALGEEGQATAKAFGYIPLPDALAKRARELVQGL